jgi:hypothetical protein
MKILSTRGLGNFQQLDRATKGQKRSQAAQMTATTEALIKAQSTLSPNLSDASHNKDIRRHIMDYIL